ncbi:hypothetical protein AtEden1_Chr3g0181461 [Arabidopsis thaliana]
MCMFCGLYSGFIHRMFMLEVKTKKIILNGMIHISVFSPLVLYI